MRASLLLATLLVLSTVAALPVALAAPEGPGIENPCDDPNVQCHPFLEGIVDWVCANPVKPCT